jgi:hypothetical protein
MSCGEQRMPDIIPRMQSQRALILFYELSKLVGDALSLHQKNLGSQSPDVRLSIGSEGPRHRKPGPMMSVAACAPPLATKPVGRRAWHLSRCVRCFEGPLRVMSVGQRPRDIGRVPPGRPGDKPIYAPSGHKATGMKPNAPFSNRMRVKHWKHPAPASNRDCLL